jgi:hypothetical protein
MHLLIVLTTAATTLLIAYIAKQYLESKESRSKYKKNHKASFQFTNASGTWQPVDARKKNANVVWSEDWDHTWQTDIQPIWAHKHENKEKENR